MPKNDRHDDDTDAFLRARGWHSRRHHGETNGYRAHYDAWGWGGGYPGGIMIICLGGNRYEVGWKTDSTYEPVVEEVLGAESIRNRAVQLEQLDDVMPT
ncbi:hypothetical protein [Williamsia maris]|uniref:Uncharacterized protein n=1 Tax=Williamsia maris TaxID=72806 RepID=A0ABT1HBA9_9NOCA|nr:hypothetical protein [Williamsia maris]MCP2175543.1 hypothetical protein [Williamsia maris]